MWSALSLLLFKQRLVRRTRVICGASSCDNPIDRVGEAVMTRLDCYNPYETGAGFWFYREIRDDAASDMRTFGASL